jgi:ferredoxin
MTAGWRVEVIRERCLSSANCVATAPGFFGLDEDGIATVTGEPGKSGESGESGEDAVRNAVAECPAAALRLLNPT